MARRTRKLRLENLSERITPTTAQLAGGTLTINGDCVVREQGGKITVDGIDIFDVGQGQNVKSVPASDVSFIEAYGDGGPNTIDLKAVKSINSYISAGEGDDNVFGTQRDDYIVGGGGKDTIKGEAGQDTIFGNAGEDKLYGGKGADDIYGGSENDYIEGNECREIHASHGQHFTFPNYLYGDEGDDTIISANCGDVMYGHDGKDSMLGNGGDDYMEGNEEDDFMDGGRGDDNMNGGEGDDNMLGDDGEDRMEGEAGDDTMDGEGGDDEINAGADNDTANGGRGDDKIELGDGNDASNGNAGDDSIEGGLGDDTMFGEAGIDEIEGGDGNDSIDGGLGNDDLKGDNDHDQIVGGRGNDEIEGGSGNDKAFGNEGNDSLEMGDGEDEADGGAGNDDVNGEGGNDIVAGGAGNDLIEGEDGSDNLDGGAGNDYLEAGDGDDLLTGGDGRDTMIGGAGRDTLHGGKNRDIMHGDEEEENEYDFANFDSYKDEFKLDKPVFGKMDLTDIALQDPHLEATLVGLGAALAKHGSKEFIKHLTVVEPGKYDIQLEGEANKRRVDFDGSWNDNDPLPKAEERLMPKTSGAEKLEFWTILFARARHDKYSVDLSTHHTDTEWNNFDTASTNKLFDAEAAFEDYSEHASTPTLNLATVTFDELKNLIADHAAIIASAAAGTGLSADNIELGSEYVVVDVIKSGGKEYVKLYNVTGYDAEPHATIVDATGTKKSDGYITIELTKFKNAANFTDLHAWL